MTRELPTVYPRSRLLNTDIIFARNYMAFEGPDCCGKTTIMSKLEKNLRQANPLSRFHVRETPGRDHPIGQFTRAQLSGDTRIKNLDPLFAAERVTYQDDDMSILFSDGFIIQSRTILSSYVYSNRGFEYVRQLNSALRLMPMTIFYLRINPEVIKQRLANKEQLDVIESTLDAERIVNAYDRVVSDYNLEIRCPAVAITVNAEAPADTVFDEVWEYTKGAAKQPRWVV